jgi:hypothetical protein
MRGVGQQKTLTHVPGLKPLPLLSVRTYCSASDFVPRRFDVQVRALNESWSGIKQIGRLSEIRISSRGPHRRGRSPTHPRWSRVRSCFVGMAYLLLNSLRSTRCVVSEEPPPITPSRQAGQLQPESAMRKPGAHPCWIAVMNRPATRYHVSGPVSRRRSIVRFVLLTSRPFRDRICDKIGIIIKGKDVPITGWHASVTDYRPGEESVLVSFRICPLP